MKLKVLRNGPPHNFSQSYPINNDGSDWSLFARLEYEIVQRLYQTAIAQYQSQDERQTFQNAWSIGSEPSLQHIEFLPLTISPRDTDNHTEFDTVFVSYNGGSLHRHSYNQDLNSMYDMELHPSLIPKCSVLDTVFVKPLLHVYNAIFVEVEPLTLSEWEMLECHAHFLEQGGILGQVSIVYPNQILHLKLNNTMECSIVRLKVLPGSFIRSNYDSQRVLDNIEVLDEGTLDCGSVQTDDDSSIALSHSTTSSVSSQSEVSSSPTEDLPRESLLPCLRLVQNTQFCIAPKPRPSVIDMPLSIPLRVGIHPSVLPQNSKMKQLFHLCNDFIPSHVMEDLNVPPKFVVLHPETLHEHVPGWMFFQNNESNNPLALLSRCKFRSCLGKREFESSHESNFSENTSNHTLVRVRSDDSIPKNIVVASALLQFELNLTPLHDKVQIQLWTPKQEQLHHVHLDRSLSVRINHLSFYNMPTSFATWCFPSGESFPPQEMGTTRDKITKRDLLQVLDQYRDLRVPITNGSFFSLVRRYKSDVPFVINIQSFEKLNDRSSQETSNILPNFVYVQDIIDMIQNNSSQIIIDKEVKNIARPEFQSFFQLLPQSSPSILGIKKTIHACLHLFEQYDGILPSTNCSSSFCPSGLLLYGEEGTGKTHLALTVSSIYRFSKQWSTIYLDCKNLQATEPKLHSILNILTAYFEHAKLLAPSIFILDNLDCLVPNTNGNSSSQESSVQQVGGIFPEVRNQVKLLSDHFRFLQLSIQNTDQPVLLIGTCIEPDSLDPMIRSVDRFSASIEVPSPNALTRTKLILHMLEIDEHSHNLHLSLTEPYLHKLGYKTEGYRTRDLYILSRRIHHEVYLRSVGRSHLLSSASNQDAQEKWIEEKIDEEITKYTPLSLRNVNLSYSNTCWKDVAGLFKAKLKLKESILYPVKFHKIYRHAPIQLPKGILLFGPSGCGKSFLVPALAKECHLNFITCKGPELLDRYIGASEAKIRQLFQRAAAASPALLFFDEFDALAPRRGSDNTGVTDRVVNQLLTFLDGVEKLADDDGLSSIYVIAATSRPNRVDPALLRPGRLEHHIYIGHPSPHESAEIFSSISKQYPVSSPAKESIHNGAILSLMLSMCEKFSYLSVVDLKSVFDSAHILAVEEFVNKSTELVKKKEACALIEENHLEVSLRNIKPSMSDKDFLSQIQEYNPFLDDDDREKLDDKSEKCHSSRKHVPNSALKTSLR